ncbi:SDR family NAD(P)-dependent oxidoreductase [Burkholderia aenigmatica]|uniref:3-oxoacyl-ACP reductase n=1 Tax=Burkholderia aenigmatica TaxID=2015348 RepID=A0A228IN91_9BURK|nr:SDR family oxidoreductase [Burkholderia aenigmatica]OXI43853.1 3-oxoacyl-ACP reductase [Burkholderia aenigmatica]
MFKELHALDGRVAVVTGANGYIGRACAHALAEWGADTVLCDINDEMSRQAVAALRTLGYSSRGWSFDVTDADAIRRAASEIYDVYGKIDILVANAGIVRNANAEAMDDVDWNNVIDVNLSGVFRCNQSFGRYMLERGSGAIVNISSIASFTSLYPQPQAGYNASKAGVNLLTKSLAGEWAARGVRVNAVAPTYIETEMTEHGAKEGWGDAWLERTPMRRMGQPAEIGAVVHFLASDASSLMTGAVVAADAGYSSW